MPQDLKGNCYLYRTVVIKDFNESGLKVREDVVRNTENRTNFSRNYKRLEKDETVGIMTGPMETAE